MNKLERLFFVYPKALELYKSHLDILMLNCTYKTNRFCMPLLNISAITSGKQVIQVAIVFLTKEREGDYNWVLECFQELILKESIEKPTITITDKELALIASLNVLFPSSHHILCYWHINMNILAKYKKHFPGPVKGPGKYFLF